MKGLIATLLVLIVAIIAYPAYQSTKIAMHAHEHHKLTRQANDKMKSGFIQSCLEDKKLYQCEYMWARM